MRPPPAPSTMHEFVYDQFVRLEGKWIYIKDEPSDPESVMKQGRLISYSQLLYTSN